MTDDFETHEDLAVMARRLEEERALPAPGFRGQLRRILLAAGNRRGATAPARLKLAIAGYGVAGALLLLVGAVSAAGIGPLGA